MQAGSCPLLTGPIGTSPNQNEDVVGCQMALSLRAAPRRLPEMPIPMERNSHSSMEGWDNSLVSSTPADVYVTKKKVILDQHNSSLLINSTGCSQKYNHWSGTENPLVGSLRSVAAL